MGRPWGAFGNSESNNCVSLTAGWFRPDSRFLSAHHCRSKFQRLFSAFQPQLKSYLYRLTASRSDADDLTHDTFIRAYNKLATFNGKLATFNGESSLKTWVFQIATSLAYTNLNRQKRWTPNVSEQAKQLVHNNESVFNRIIYVSETPLDARYDMKEHIDTCFT